jgi:hypothetical protein
MPADYAAAHGRTYPSGQVPTPAPKPKPGAPAPVTKEAPPTSTSTSKFIDKHLDETSLVGKIKRNPVKQG